jgi:hypothetical protein
LFEEWGVRERGKKRMRRNMGRQSFIEQKPQANPENDVKHPEVKRQSSVLYVGILYKERQTGITVWG